MNKHVHNLSKNFWKYTFFKKCKYSIVALLVLVLIHNSSFCQDKGLQRQVDSLQLEIRLRDIDVKNYTIVNSLQNRLDQQDRIISKEESQIDRWTSFTEIFFGVVGVILALFAFFGFRQIKQYSDMAKRDLKEIEEIVSQSKKQELAIKSRHDELQRFKPEEILSEQNKKVVDAALEEAKSQLEKSGLDALKNLYHAKAIAAYAKDDWESTRRFCESYLDFDENNSDMWHRLSYCLKELGLEDKALKGYNKAIDLNQNAIKSYVNRSNILRNKSKYKEALSDLNKALELDPSLDVYINRALVLYELKNYNDAIADCDKAMSVQNSRWTAFGIKGLCLSELGQFDEALNAFNEAVALDATDAFVHYSRHLCWLNLGEKEKAIADLNKAIELNPNDSSYQRALENLTNN